MAKENTEGHAQEEPDAGLPEPKTILPPPADPGQPKQPPICEDTLTQRLLIVSRLFSNEDPDLRKCAANLLVILAESGDCTIPSARRIVDILELQNKKDKNDFSSQLRKARAALKGKIDYLDSPEFVKRKTIPVSRDHAPSVQGAQDSSGPKKAHKAKAGKK